MLSLLSVGYYHPENVIDNKFIVSLGVDTTEEWIVEKIGIETRRTVLPLEYIRETKNQNPSEALRVSSVTPAEMGARAARMACERAGILPKQLGLIICDSCFPHQTTPSEAQRIAAVLGVSAKAFDVLTACPAFALHVDFLNSHREEVLPDYVLCVTTAAFTQTVNYTDRTDGAIWGDGAAACLFSTKHPGKLTVLDSSYTTDPSRAGAVVIDRYGFFKQDGRAVRDFSVRQTVRLIKAIESRFQIDWTKDIFVGHQANATMLRQVTDNREIPDSNHWRNVVQFGNQGGSGAPAVLGMNWDKIISGQKIVVAVLGAGLSWGSVLLEAR